MTVAIGIVGNGDFPRERQPKCGRQAVGWRRIITGVPMRAYRTPKMKHLLPPSREALARRCPPLCRSSNGLDRMYLNAPLETASTTSPSRASAG